MKIQLEKKASKINSQTLICYLLTDENVVEAQKELQQNIDKEIEVPKKAWERGTEQFISWQNKHVLLIGIGEKGKLIQEHARTAICSAVELANKTKLEKLSVNFVYDSSDGTDYLTAISETVFLANYQFLIYKSEKKENSLKSAEVVSNIKGADKAIKDGAHIAEATMIARDLVNEPVITLTAPEMAKRAEKWGKKYGFSVEVFNKAKIESLKMGGLLAVNFGSPDPPTFTIMEWKPKKPKNKKPLVLVGKGVVFDTGGLSLKPTANSMDFMKSDMGGAAAVIGAMCGLAMLESDYHVIGLVPATDNRPGQNAYVPGDVITMMNGSTVEVLNTDAEGRMILADALTYAKKYDPELVIDLATLTGAAVIAVGTEAIAVMSTAEEETKSKIKAAGERVFERLVELPLWEEYGNQLKSDIADLKNVGGRPAGSITAGKFLEHFTDYPWIHLDIAGAAFLNQNSSYRGKNGTGVGVRLLIDFINNY